LITWGINEKTGGATDRGDPQGRPRLLDKYTTIYRVERLFSGDYLKSLSKIGFVFGR
jgi:hypothetical protein